MRAEMRARADGAVSAEKCFDVFRSIGALKSRSASSEWPILSPSVFAAFFVSRPLFCHYREDFTRVRFMQLLDHLFPFRLGASAYLRFAMVEKGFFA